MKNLILLTCLSSYSFAIDIILNDPCKDEVKELISVQVLEPIQLKKLLYDLFDTYQVPYTGVENGINSLFGTPYGNSAFFMDDYSNIRSYGWCYAINGVQPSVTIDNYAVDPNQVKVIEWTFGRAKMVNGEWITYCQPVHQITDLDAGICQK